MKTTIQLILFLFLMSLSGMAQNMPDTTHMKDTPKKMCDNCSMMKSDQKSDISIEKLNLLLSKKENNQSFDLVLLDVRTPEEFNDGHIQSAINIDYLSADFKETIQKMNKEKQYAVICRSGNRSKKAQKVMEELGFKKVLNVLGGMKAWKTAQLPVK